jgi:hypothetical protein
MLVSKGGTLWDETIAMLSRALDKAETTAERLAILAEIRALARTPASLRRGTPDEVVDAILARTSPDEAAELLALSKDDFWIPLAKAKGDAKIRVLLMLTFLEEQREREDIGKSEAKIIDRMWIAYRGPATTWHKTVRRYASTMDHVARAREKYGVKAAKLIFVRLLDATDAAATGYMRPEVFELVDTCAQVWRRRAGRPAAFSPLPTKWEAFAELLTALGNPADADDLKRECLRKKNGRTARH